MASGPPPFASSKETTNYARLCRLLVDVGTQVLRDTFDTIHPPATLHKSLSTAHPTLQSLKKKRILNGTQWKSLYPTSPSSVSSASFDITLLMVLLRNICSLTPPASTGSWDNPPNAGDNSPEANVVRIKYYRNEIYAHASQASVDDVTFSQQWQDISNALLALGADATVISRLETECMDPGVEEDYRKSLKQWKKDDDNTKEKLENLEEMLKSGFGEVKDILKRLETDEGNSKDTLEETRELSKHLKDKISEMEDTLKRLVTDDDSSKDTLKETHEISKHLRDKFSDLEDTLKRLETDEVSSKDILKETHEMLKQLKSPGDSSSSKLGETEDAYGPAADLIDVIQQLYKSREGWLTPFPWCEEFQFHLDSIFTRLKIVSRKKERGVKTDSIINMLEIFKPHEECSQPRKVLIEGQPGMGKTTYCNKVAFDWAKDLKYEDSFPDVQVLLLLRCREINSDLWEAIDDQILPRDIKKEEREKFFTFIRDHQSKVLLVLDGLDELPTHKLPVYKEIIQGRMLSKCYLVVTARHEAGIKLRECCDTLLEVEGFTKNDAEDFIRRYLKTEKRLAQKLLDKLRTDATLSGLTANPLNTALLCLLCEDFQGDLPKGRTLLYHEIVQCVLRRYRRKKELPETDEDLRQLYQAELKHLGCIALHGLLNEEMSFDHSVFRNVTSNLIPEFGFLSVQAGRSKRRPNRCYGFLHKSFQEFFAAFYLSCQLVDEEISPDGLVADTRYFKEFQQVLMFTFGILAQQCEAKAMAVMASIANQINQSTEEDESCDYLCTAFNCIKECEKDTFGKELARFLGSVLEIKLIWIRGQIGVSGAAILGDAIAANSTVTQLDLYGESIGDSGAAALAKAVEINSTLTKLYLSTSRIYDSGAAALAKALEINSTLTQLKLSENGIGDSGAAALAKAVEINSTLTELALSRNEIRVSGATALAQAVEINSTLTGLYFSGNKGGDLGAAALAKAVEINSTLTRLDLSHNEIGDSGAVALAKAVEINSTLTMLALSDNRISELGAAALAKAVEINSTLTVLYLFSNRIGYSGAAALAKAVEINSTLTTLHLSNNRIGEFGAAALAKAVEINATLTTLHLSNNRIGEFGAAALAKAVEINPTLTRLELYGNGIGDSGAAALAKAVEINSTLTELSLSKDGIDDSKNGIGDSGAAALAKAVEINSTLTKLNLSHYGIGNSGAAALAKALVINSALTELNLSHNGIGDSGAAALAKAVEINSTLTRLYLDTNGISDSGAAALAKAVEVNSTLTTLALCDNRIGDSGAAALAKAVEINSTLRDLNLSHNAIGDAGASALAKAVEINSTLTKLYLSRNGIGDPGAAALAKARKLTGPFGPVKRSFIF
ncbi:NLR family CARD domain-containing protein 3-like isoform X2 [Montipora capricornis]|uniref:NLR family CARD domain-containing protein 3-like isoform X2 n=1 Tax=Montipora capricornis TaxID=246305 RepID=UPI0035F1F8F6